MKRFVFATVVVAGLGMVAAERADAQGCAGGMCAVPGAAGQQAVPMQQTMPGMPAQQAAPGTSMPGGMCGCCRQMAMMQPNPQGGAGQMPGMGMGGTPQPPAAPGAGDQPPR